MREILGQSVITIDLESTKNLYDSGWRIICISEVNEDKISMPDMMMGSLLIPPYDTMDLLLDGKYDEFAAMYSQYLYSSQEVEMMISIMLTALYQGVNIVLYVPKNVYELNFIPVLAAFISDTTGIVYGNPYTQAIYNKGYNDRNMARLYTDGFMQYSDMLVYTDGDINDPYTCIRMCRDIGYITEDQVDAINYIKGYKNRIRMNNNIFLPKGLIKV